MARTSIGQINCGGKFALSKINLNPKMKYQRRPYPSPYRTDTTTATKKAALEKIKRLLGNEKSSLDALDPDLQARLLEEAENNLKYIHRIVVLRSDCVIWYHHDTMPGNRGSKQVITVWYQGKEKSEGWDEGSRRMHAPVRDRSIKAMRDCALNEQTHEVTITITFTDKDLPEQRLSLKFD